MNADVGEIFCLQGHLRRRAASDSNPLRPQPGSIFGEIGIVGAAAAVANAVYHATAVGKRVRDVSPLPITLDKLQG